MFGNGEGEGEGEDYDRGIVSNDFISFLRWQDDSDVAWTSLNPALGGHLASCVGMFSHSARRGCVFLAQGQNQNLHQPKKKIKTSDYSNGMVDTCNLTSFDDIYLKLILLMVYI